MDGSGVCLPCETAKIANTSHDRCIGNGCRCACRTALPPSAVQEAVAQLKEERDAEVVGRPVEAVEPYEPEKAPCQYCGSLRIAGAGLASHERACPLNPKRGMPRAMAGSVTQGATIVPQVHAVTSVPPARIADMVDALRRERAVLARKVERIDAAIAAVEQILKEEEDGDG